MILSRKKNAAASSIKGKVIEISAITREGHGSDQLQPGWLLAIAKQMQGLKQKDR
jgi:hypothetical protein